ncbi:MAG TPA: hypothetical protein VLS25_07120, partial [Dehalococcoidia bacterium]|nr:hypothetical protein [Dehalococcoidia bacterium]
PIGDDLGGGASSEQLIDDALAAHSIDAETALVYKVYAAFGDSRLPPQYRGDDSEAEDSDAVREAAAQFDSLSPEHQGNLAPFLLPPSAPGSWLDLQTVPQSGASYAAVVEWTTYTAAGGKVKVWAQDRYPGDAAKAQGIAAAMTGTIWDALIGLMGPAHTPITDQGLANNGGDSALDIYLVHMSDRGVTLPSDPARKCQIMPDYININSARPLGDATHPGLIQTATHEFFHAIQDTYPLATGCWAPEYAWFTEASAKWAEDYVYPDAQSEHPYASEFLDFGRPQLSLDDRYAAHEYGAYLFPFYLRWKLNQPQIVRFIWEAFATGKSLEAIDEITQLAGGFDTLWPEFALWNWNRDPIRHYKDLDELDDGAATVDGGAIAVSLGGAPSQTFEVSADVSYLAAAYHHFVFSDDSVHSVVFENTVAFYPHAKVQALTKVGGHWNEPEDWTEDVRKTFCRDTPDQRVEELVIIISYSNWEDQDAITPSEPPSLHANDSGCSKWFGVATATYHNTQIGDYTETATAQNVVFDRVPPPPGPYGWETFKTVSGSVKWEVSGTIGDCSLSGSVTAPVKDGDGFIQVSNYLVTPEDQRMYNGSAASEAVMPVTMACPDGPPVVFEWVKTLYSWFSTGGEQPVGQDGSRLIGQFDSTYNGTGDHYTWDFSAGR